MIEVINLRKHYGQLKAVDNVSFQVKSGEVFGILGPNGAGKTTTLEMIEGLRQPDGGKIFIDGKPVWPNPQQTKQLIGVQLQSTSLLDYLTIREILILFASFYKKGLNKTELDKLLDTVGLSEKRKANVKELSGGQQQRLSIALALVNDPKVIFLDEPTTGLDPQARHHLWDLIRQINLQGKTIVLTTHYMEEAELLCQRVAVMDYGKIIALDTPANLINNLLGKDKAGKEKLTFTAPEQLASKLMELDIGQITQIDSSYILYTDDPQKSVLEIFRLAEREKIDIKNLAISGANLEDVFLYLTGRALRD
jgi:ABC-2 type transport system ATP-binding protein